MRSLLAIIVMQIKKKMKVKSIPWSDIASKYFHEERDDK